MAQTTANLALPLIAAAQAGKHVTHNEALTGLDTLTQLACLDKDRAAPPGNPAEGDRYLLAAAAPTGAWAGLSGQIVRYQDGHWVGYPPKAGWLAWVIDESDLYVCTGAAWIGFRATITALQGLTRLGIGTTADATNPFAAKLNKALWTALSTSEGGSGDLRHTLNKQAPGNTLSLLLQTAFSGRAEIGLTGDDDLHVKVSANGSTFLEALRIDRATGAAALTAGTAASPSLAFSGDSNTGAFSPGPDCWAVSTGGAERLRVGADGRVGLGVSAPRTALDLGPGLLSGSATDYAQIQHSLMGGGTITWGGVGGRLKWTSRFIGIPGSRPSFAGGLVQVDPPTSDLPAAQCWDGSPRSANASGVALTNWDALYAVHAPGGAPNAITLQIVNYAAGFNAASNWVLIAAVCGDNGAIRLGSGVILKAGGSWTAGADAQYAPLLPQDNATNLGGPSNRYAALYAGSGAINTSDAREKTPTSPLTAAEIAAARALAGEIGTFRFLDAVTRKGGAARRHAGLTVQRAMAVMESHGLDPFAYAFICHDSWEAVAPVAPVEGPGGAVGAGEPGRPAGDRYGFRTDELLLFLARGVDARLAALEACRA